jgi:hypothetical protein
MATTILLRDQWGAAPPTKTLPVSMTLKGVCLHWMGFPIEGDTARLVRSIQRNHMSPPKGWWDVAYNELISQTGVVVEGRGLGVRSGAQGSTRHNRDYIALGLLVGPDQTPTPQMIEAVKERIAVVRFFQPDASEIVGHLDLKPTTCPGPEVYRLMKAGAFEPGTEVKQTIEQRVEALEAAVEAINARF